MRWTTFWTGVIASGALLASGCGFVAAEDGADSPGPAGPAGNTETFEGDGTMETATFAAGCFWGVEAAFRRVQGVKATSVGYTGGHTESPTYKQVCSGTTGHAEAVQVVFDPAAVSYEDLLDVFWTCHDPTQVNRQGPDIGEQYRSAIFHHNEAQKEAAEASKRRLGESGRFSRPIATEVTEAGPFWRAEEYHQQYLEKRGLASCHL